MIRTPNSTARFNCNVEVKGGLRERSFRPLLHFFNDPNSVALLYRDRRPENSEQERRPAVVESFMNGSLAESAVKTINDCICQPEGSGQKLDPDEAGFVRDFVAYALPQSLWSHVINEERPEPRFGFIISRANGLGEQDSAMPYDIAKQVFGGSPAIKDGFGRTGFKCAVEGQVPDLYLKAIKERFSDPSFLSGFYEYQRPEMMVFSGASSVGGKQISGSFPVFIAWLYSLKSDLASMMYHVDREIQYTLADMHMPLCPSSSDARKLCEILVRGFLPEQVIGKPVYPEALPFTDPGFPKERLQQAYDEAVRKLESTDKKAMLETALMGRDLPVPQEPVTDMMRTLLTP